MKKRILFLLDASGSMGEIRQAAIDGFNAWKHTLELVENDVRITVASFNEGPPTIIYNDQPVRDIPDLTMNEYYPRNYTALYDAIGFVITRIDKLMEPQDSALVVILTDGEENVSRTYDRATILKMITEREKQGWGFSYISAGAEAFRDASNIGISKANTVTFEASNDGTQVAYAAITRSSLSYLSGEKEDDTVWTAANSSSAPSHQ